MSEQQDSNSQNAKDESKSIIQISSNSFTINATENKKLPSNKDELSSGSNEKPPPKSNNNLIKN